MKRDIFDQLRLPLGLRIEIDENLQRKPLTQSELAAQQRCILKILRKHTAPGTRTDLADPATSAQNCAQVKRATAVVARLFGESARQVETRIAVVEAAEADPEGFGRLVEKMDSKNSPYESYAELQRIKREEAEALPNNGEARVTGGDFREVGGAVDDNSVDFIITDPPWASEDVPLFGDLAQFAARVLIPGGSLITYTGHHTLPEVLPLMTPHLKFHWMCAEIHPDQHPPQRRLGVYSGFHLLPWFTKGQRPSAIMVMDCVKGVRGNKITQHKWAQGVPTALYYINKLSRRGSLIVDPFLGSGTTAVAALKAGRRFVGFEKNLDTALKAEKRIARLKKTA